MYLSNWTDSGSCPYLAHFPAYTRLNFSRIHASFVRGRFRLFEPRSSSRNFGPKVRTPILARGKTSSACLGSTLSLDPAYQLTVRQSTLPMRPAFLIATHAETGFLITLRKQTPTPHSNRNTFGGGAGSGSSLYSIDSGAPSSQTPRKLSLWSLA